MRRNLFRSALASASLAAVVAGSLFASEASAARRRPGFVPVPGAERAPATANELLAPFAGGPDTQCGVVTYCGGPVISNA